MNYGEIGNSTWILPSFFCLTFWTKFALVKRHYLFSILLVAWLGYSCESVDSGPQALVNLILVDSPAKWDSVLVEIEGVEVEMLIEGRETGSQNFYFEYKTGDKQIRISDLVGGRGLIIGREELPVGKIIGLSVRMGTSHALYQGEKGYSMSLVDPTNLFVPLPANVDLESGIAYDIILDMDLDKSILQKSTSPLQFQLEPSFTLVEGTFAGEVQGTAAPVSLKPAIYLIQGTDSISTHLTTSGAYLFRVAPGSYSVYFDPKDSNYDAAILTDVIVERGKSTQIPLHTFQVKP